MIRRGAGVTPRQCDRKVEIPQEAFIAALKMDG